MSKRSKDASRAASIMGQRGGAKGGHARAAALSPERRSEIARRAALARHHGIELPPSEQLVMELPSCPRCGALPRTLALELRGAEVVGARCRCAIGHYWRHMTPVDET